MAASPPAREQAEQIEQPGDVETPSSVVTTPCEMLSAVTTPIFSTGVSPLIDDPHGPVSATVEQYGHMSMVVPLSASEAPEREEVEDAWEVVASSNDGLTFDCVGLPETPSLPCEPRDSYKAALDCLADEYLASPVLVAGPAVYATPETNELHFGATSDASNTLCSSQDPFGFEYDDVTLTGALAGVDVSMDPAGFVESSLQGQQEYVAAELKAFPTSGVVAPLSSSYEWCNQARENPPPAPAPRPSLVVRGPPPLMHALPEKKRKRTALGSDELAEEYITTSQQEKVRAFLAALSHAVVGTGTPIRFSFPAHNIPSGAFN